MPASIRAGGCRDIIAEPIRAFTVCRRAPDAIHGAAPSSCCARSAWPPPTREKFPHEFSGGQRQRISIARALASQAGVPGLRRADLGARRLGAGADPEPDARPAARARPHLPVHLPQPRRRRATWRPRRRACISAGIVELAPKRSDSSSSRAIPYTRMLLDAIPDIEMTGKRTHARGRRGAQSARSARRVHLSPALPACQRTLHARAPGADRRRRRCRRRLPRGAGTPGAMGLISQSASRRMSP